MQGPWSIASSREALQMNLLLLGYIGPESTLPLASALAAVVGVALMGWNYMLLAGKKVVSRFRRIRSFPANHE